MVAVLEKNQLIVCQTSAIQEDADRMQQILDDAAYERWEGGGIRPSPSLSGILPVADSDNTTFLEPPLRQKSPKKNQQQTSRQMVPKCQSPPPGPQTQELQPTPVQNPDPPKSNGAQGLSPVANKPLEDLMALIWTNHEEDHRQMNQLCRQVAIFQHCSSQDPRAPLRSRSPSQECCAPAHQGRETPSPPSYHSLCQYWTPIKKFWP